LYKRLQVKFDSVLVCVGEFDSVLVSAFRLTGGQVGPAPSLLGVQAATAFCGRSDAQSVQVTDLSGRHSGDLEGTLPGMTIMPFAF
jgi:hypothetical protein